MANTENKLQQGTKSAATSDAELVRDLKKALERYEAQNDKQHSVKPTTIAELNDRYSKILTNQSIANHSASYRISSSNTSLYKRLLNSLSSFSLFSDSTAESYLNRAGMAASSSQALQNDWEKISGDFFAAYRKVTSVSPD